MLRFKLVWHIGEHSKGKPTWMAPGDSGAFYTCSKAEQDWTLDVSMGNTVHELWAPTAQAGRAIAEVIEKAIMKGGESHANPVERRSGEQGPGRGRTGAE